MKPTKNITTLERRYDNLGVDVTTVVNTVEGYLIAEDFQCRSCGTNFSPDAKRVRNRHRCPNGCNAGKSL